MANEGRDVYAYVQSEVERITPTASDSIESTRNTLAKATGLRPFVQLVKLGPRDPMRKVIVHFTEDEFQKLGEWLEHHPQRKWF